MTKQGLLKLLLASIDYGIENNHPMLVQVSAGLINAIMSEDSK